MKSQLIALESSKINSVNKVHDYLQLKFSNGSILNIYNRYETNAKNLKDFENNKVTKVFVDKELFKLNAENHKFICVSLKDEDYLGPEAMEMKIEENIFVWGA